MVCFCLWVLIMANMSLYSSNVAIGYNVSGVYEVGAFKAQMFISTQKFNSSTKAECLTVSPNLINTLLAVVAVFKDKI